jgi:hypothetical protein
LVSQPFAVELISTHFQCSFKWFPRVLPILLFQELFRQSHIGDTVNIATLHVFQGQDTFAEIGEGPLTSRWKTFLNAHCPTSAVKNKTAIQLLPIVRCPFRNFHPGAQKTI